MTGRRDSTSARPRAVLVVLLALIGAAAAAAWGAGWLGREGGAPASRAVASAAAGSGIGDSADPGSETSEPGAGPGDSGEAPLGADRLARYGVPAASRSAPPELLQGPGVGGLEADERGRFRPDAETLRLFEFFFLACSAEPVDVVRGRIVLRILDTLPETAQAEAVAALDRYLALRARVERMSPSERPDLARAADPQRALAQLRELQRAELGDELAAALYGEQNRKLQWRIESEAVRADGKLGDAEREARLREIDRQLPDDLRAARQQNAAQQRALREVEELQARGAPAEQIFAVRERAFGRAAAERLGALDAQNVQWTLRWESYRAEREQVLADLSVPEADLGPVLEELRRRHFPNRRDLSRARSLDAGDLRKRELGLGPD